MRCPCMCCYSLCLADWVSYSTRVLAQSPTTAISERHKLVFKSQLYVEDLSQKLVLILANGPSKPRERVLDRNLISAVGVIQTTTS